MQPESLPRPSDKWIPYYFFAFFGVLILVLVPMAVIAVRTNTGIVTEHPYEKGLAYNKAIEADDRQKALNWHGSLTVTPDDAGKTNVDFALTDQAGKMLSDATVTLWLVRPTQNGMDQKTDMTADSDGHYRATLSLPAKGLWEARVSATVNGQNYQTTKRVEVP